LKNFAFAKAKGSNLLTLLKQQRNAFNTYYDSKFGQSTFNKTSSDLWLPTMSGQQVPSGS
jgi:hypothetical protein